MNNLVEILSGKHGNVTLMMTASERKKLARMRNFLCAEEEIYEKLDHYDIANMTDAELDGLLALSFDPDQIELPDDVEDLLDDLRRDIGEEEDPSPKGGGPVSFFGHCQRYGIAASLFVALFFSGYLVTSSDRNITDLSVTPPQLDTDGFGPSRSSDIVMLSPIEAPTPFKDASNTAVSAAGLSYSSLPSVVSASDPAAVSAAPNMTVDSMIGFVPEQLGVEVAAASDDTTPFSVGYTNVSVQEPLQFGLQSDSGGWIISEGNGLSADEFAGRVTSVLQQRFGEDVVTRGLVDGDNGNVIVQVDGLELHIFNFTLSEGESVYTIARETEVDPNIFHLINRALEEGAQIDTTTMALNDRIIGIAARQGDQYALSELVYDRARSSDMLVYSGCANFDQVTSLSSASFNSRACMASAVQSLVSASTDLQ